MSPSPFGSMCFAGSPSDRSASPTLGVFTVKRTTRWGTVGGRAGGRGGRRGGGATTRRGGGGAGAPGGGGRWGGGLGRPPPAGRAPERADARDDCGDGRRARTEREPGLPP